MSATETPRVETEKGSSVKLVRNAKGDTQIELKVYVGDTQQELDEARQFAEMQYDLLVKKYGGGS